MASTQIIDTTRKMAVSRKHFRANSIKLIEKDLLESQEDCDYGFVVKCSKTQEGKIDIKSLKRKIITNEPFKCEPVKSFTEYDISKTYVEGNHELVVSSNKSSITIDSLFAYVESDLMEMCDSTDVEMSVGFICNKKRKSDTIVVETRIFKKKKLA